jgi:hypothetical protein
MNAFLIDEMFKDVKLTVPTATNSDVCGGLWRRTKTCCNERLTKELANNNAHRLDNAARNFFNHLQNLQSNFKSFHKREVRCLEENNLRCSNITGRKELEFLVKLLDEQKMVNFHDALWKCTNHLKVVRNSALCSICAGDSRDYFFQLTDKAAVSMPACVAMMGNCDNFFNKTMSLVKGSMKLGRRTANLIEDEDQHAKWIATLSDKVDTTEIIQGLARLNDTLSRTEKDNIYSSLCGYLFRLVKKPMVEELVPLIEYLSRKLLAILDDFSSARAQEEALASRALFGRNEASRELVYGNSNPLARNLTGEGLLEGDASVLKPTDNIFTSFEGSQGSSQFHEHHPTRPMNLSLTFP